MVEEMAKDPEKYYEKMDKMYDKYFELKEKGEIVENDIPQDLNM